MMMDEVRNCIADELMEKFEAQNDENCMELIQIYSEQTLGFLDDMGLLDEQRAQEFAIRRQSLIIGDLKRIQEHLKIGRAHV